MSGPASLPTLAEYREAARIAFDRSTIAPVWLRALRDPRNETALDAFFDRQAEWMLAMARVVVAHECTPAAARLVSAAALAWVDAYNALLLGITTLDDTRKAS